tara:strand:+ start:92 stop:541 length:450 start_codon:yes stop_codon:yes gene_type:complete
MTYKQRHARTTRLIELSADGSQTVTNGDTIYFQNKRTTGGDSISVNNGVISLSSSKSYFLQFAFSIERPSNTSNGIFTWYNATTNTALTKANGAFLGEITTTALANGSRIAVMYADKPSYDIKIVVSGMSSGNATIREETNISIMEIDT